VSVIVEQPSAPPAPGLDCVQLSLIHPDVAEVLDILGNADPFILKLLTSRPHTGLATIGEFTGFDGCDGIRTVLAACRATTTHLAG